MNRKAILKEQIKILRYRMKVTLGLIREFGPDFLAINFKCVDNVQHLFWGDWKIVFRIYRLVDDYIKCLAEEMEASHIMLMSDHGFHKAEDTYFYINTWLAREGYLRLKPGWPNLYRTAINAFKKFFRMNALRYLILDALKRDVATVSFLDYIDLEESSAFASSCGIFLLKGERRLGEKIRAKLLKLRDPASQDNIMAAVFRREELYHGPFLEKFPDLILIPKPRFLINPWPSDVLLEKRMDKPYLRGAHKSDPLGIFIVHGPGVKAGFEIKEAKIVDITPTVLFMYGIPPLGDMDGRVLSEIFTPEFIKSIRLQGLIEKVKVKEAIRKLRSQIGLAS